MAKAAFCLASSEFQAEAIVNEAKTIGFSDEEISVLLPDKGGILIGGFSGKTQYAFSWLPGMEILSIPGSGSFAASGPIKEALAGASAGATTGTIRSVFDSMGIPDAQAQNYENQIMSGAILVFVLSESQEHINQALSIFEHAGAREITVTSDVEPHPKPPELRDEKWEQW